MGARKTRNRGTWISFIEKFAGRSLFQRASHTNDITDVRYNRSISRNHEACALYLRYCLCGGRLRLLQPLAVFVPMVIGDSPQEIPHKLRRASSFSLTQLPARPPALELRRQSRRRRIQFRWLITLRENFYLPGSFAFPFSHFSHVFPDNTSRPDTFYNTIFRSINIYYYYFLSLCVFNLRDIKRRDDPPSIR